MSRPYTGTKDGISKKKRPGTEIIYRGLSTMSDGNIYGLGTHVIRKMRGKPLLSVHATGRAMDLGWRRREPVRPFIEAIIAAQEELGLEYFADYWYREPKAKQRFGRGWRCDRMRWSIYKKRTIEPMGAQLFHMEISPAVADSPERARAALDAVRRHLTAASPTT